MVAMWGGAGGAVGSGAGAVWGGFGLAGVGCGFLYRGWRGVIGDDRCVFWCVC